MREFKVLRVISHPNIIKLKEIIKNKDQLISVYEYCDETLFSYCQSIFDQGIKLSETEIKSIIY